MARGDQKIENVPYRIWRVPIEEQNRVRVPLGEIRLVLPWLPSQPDTVDCVGTLGPAGGIQIAPTAIYERVSRDFIEALSSSSPRSAESGQNWVDLARYLATAWRIPVSIETSRISFTVPEPIRRAQLLPGHGGTVIAFGFGEIFEVWEEVKWHDHMRGLAKTKLHTTEEVIENLRDRLGLG